MLSKPFSPRHLLTTVNEVLEAQGRGVSGDTYVLCSDGPADG